MKMMVMIVLMIIWINNRRYHFKNIGSAKQCQ